MCVLRFWVLSMGESLTEGMHWLGMTSGAQLLKNSSWLLHLIGDEAPPILLRKLLVHLVLMHSPTLVSRIVHPGWSDGCCPVRATGGSLPRGRCLLPPLTETPLYNHRVFTEVNNLRNIPVSAPCYYNDV